MGFFDRTLLERPANDLKYFVDCCIFQKKNREDRLKNQKCQCQFWLIDYKNYTCLKNKGSILPAALGYAEDIYYKFEEDFGFREHEEYCIYHKDEKERLSEKCQN